MVEVTLFLFLLFLLHSSVILSQRVAMPSLGLGTAGLFRRTEDVVSMALDIGVKLIDTAQAVEWYDEEAVSKAIRVKNVSDVFIVTKVHPRSYSLHDMETSLQKSHNYFGGKGTVDAVLLHAPFCWQGHCTEEQEAVPWWHGWLHLEKMQDNFDIPHIGVSNMDIDQMEELVLRYANRKVSILQNWMDPLHQDVAVRRFCSDHGIIYMAYSSFGTQWSSSRRAKGRNPVLTNPTLMKIAEEKGATVSQVILSWLAAEGVVAIPRASSADHIRENFEICHPSKNAFEAHALCDREGSFHLPVVGGTVVHLNDTDLEKIRALDNTFGSPWD